MGNGDFLLFFGGMINCVVDIDFNNIEIMSILKGVVVMVLYGFWVVNGVVLIMIKFGKQGIKFCIIFSMNYGFSEV